MSEESRNCEPCPQCGKPLKLDLCQIDELEHIWICCDDCKKAWHRQEEKVWTEWEEDDYE